MSKINVLIIFMITGCTSVSPYKQTSSVYGGSPSIDIENRLVMSESMQNMQNMQNIVEGSTKTASWILKNAGLNSQIESKVTRVSVSGSKEIFDIDLSVKKIDAIETFFKPGIYDIANDKSGSVFIYAVGDILSSIKNKLDQNSNLTFKLTFFGGADGLKVRPGSIRYKAEFGETATLSSWYLNGKEQAPISINKGDSLTNEMIAFLRAYSGYYYFNKRLYNSNLTAAIQSQKLIVQTSQKVATNLRFLRINVQIVSN